MHPTKINKKETKMKRILLATAAAVMLAVPAMAGDLPSRKVVIEAPAPAPRLPFFVGINGGGNWTTGVGKVGDGQFGSVGFNAGYEVNNYLRGELAYDHLFGQSVKALNSVTGSADLVTGNMILQYPINGFTPYVIGGLGYRWGYFKDELVYNVGAGVRYDLTQTVSLDARYRFVSDFNNNTNNNLFTLGFGVKF